MHCRALGCAKLKWKLPRFVKQSIKYSFHGIEQILVTMYRYLRICQILKLRHLRPSLDQVWHHWYEQSRRRWQTTDQTGSSLHSTRAACFVLRCCFCILHWPITPHIRLRLLLLAGMGSVLRQGSVRGGDTVLAFSFSSFQRKAKRERKTRWWWKVWPRLNLSVARTVVEIKRRKFSFR